MVSDKPQVVVEQLLLPGATELTEVHRFNLDGDKCWRSSAVFDYAIFEVAVPQDINLVQLETPVAPVGINDVHVVGFPGALQEHTLDHPYATIPAEITGWRGNKMILSSTPASGFSGGGVVCTKRGGSCGICGGGYDGSAKNELRQSYGLTFLGMPPRLTVIVAEGDTKDDLRHNTV